MSTRSVAARAAILTLLPALLAGCPYIWEPPQLAGDVDTDPDPVPPLPGPDTDDTDPGDTDTDPGDTDPGDTDTDPGDTDTDTDPGDTDTDPGDTDTDTDPGDTGDTDLPPPGDPPVIANVTASYRFGRVVLAFQLSDVDGDLSGGTLWLSEDGGAPTAHLVPGDLDTWDGAEGTLELQVGTPCGGIDRQYDLTPEDAAGHVGSTLGAHMDVGGHAVVEQPGAFALGAIDLPAIVCGDLSNGNDVDATSFTPNQGGTWQFSLTWPGNLDRDVVIAEQGGNQVAAAQSQAKPDTAQATLTAGTPYVAEVSSPAAGPGSNWLLVVHE